MWCARPPNTVFTSCNRPALGEAQRRTGRRLPPLLERPWHLLGKQPEAMQYVTVPTLVDKLERSAQTEPTLNDPEEPRWVN